MIPSANNRLIISDFKYFITIKMKHIVTCDNDCTSHTFDSSSTSTSFSNDKSESWVESTYVRKLPSYDDFQIQENSFLKKLEEPSRVERRLKRKARRRSFINAMFSNIKLLVDASRQLNKFY